MLSMRALSNPASGLSLANQHVNPNPSPGRLDGEEWDKELFAAGTIERRSRVSLSCKNVRCLFTSKPSVPNRCRRIREALCGMDAALQIVSLSVLYLGEKLFRKSSAKVTPDRIVYISEQNAL